MFVQQWRQEIPKLTQSRAEHRRRQLLDAAAACFSSEGIHGTTVLDISQRAGFSVGTLYRHFGSKENVVMALAEKTCRQDALLVERLFATEPPSNQREAMESLFLERLQDLLSPKEARLRIELWTEALRHPALRATLRRGLKEASDKVEGVLKAANGQNGASATDARKMVGLFQGAVLYRALGVRQSGRSLGNNKPRAAPLRYG